MHYCAHTIVLLNLSHQFVLNVLKFTFVFLQILTVEAALKILQEILIDNSRFNERKLSVEMRESLRCLFLIDNHM